VLAQLCAQQPLDSQRWPLPQAGLHFWQVPEALQYEAVPQAAAQSWQVPLAPQNDDGPQGVAQVEDEEASGLPTAPASKECVVGLLQAATSSAAKITASPGEVRFMGSSRQSFAD